MNAYWYIGLLLFGANLSLPPSDSTAKSCRQLADLAISCYLLQNSWSIFDCALGRGGVANHPLDRPMGAADRRSEQRFDADRAMIRLYDTLELAPVVKVRLASMTTVTRASESDVICYITTSDRAKKTKSQTDQHRRLIRLRCSHPRYDLELAIS